MSEKIPLGAEFRNTFSFSQNDVIAFANLTGDHNPVHLDAEYAATTRFKVPIIHGHLSSSVFTKYLGMEKPGGPGSIYLKQVTEYLRPMFVDTEYEVIFRITQIDPIKHVADIQLEIVNKETRKITIKGVGTLMNVENF